MVSTQLWQFRNLTGALSAFTTASPSGTTLLVLGADKNFSLALINTTSTGSLDWNFTINFDV
jgi:hypothetical protein